MTIPRNDRRTQARDVYGKPGVSYENDDADYPKIVEHRTGRQGEALKEYLTPHPKYTTALLTIQQSSPGDNTDINITEVYETLPGPWIPSREYDTELGPVQVRRRLVVYTGQAASLSGTLSISYQARDVSNLVAWEIEKVYSTGAGTADNPAFPIGVVDFYDDDKGAVQQVTQLVTATGSEVGTIAGTSTITQTTYQPINAYVLRKTIETWGLPGPMVTTQRIGQRGEAVTQTTQLVQAGTPPTADALLVIESAVQADNEVQSKKIVESVASHPTITSKSYPGSVKGALATTTKQKVAPDASVPAPGASYGGGIVIESSLAGISGTKSEQEITIIPAWPVIYDWLWEEEVKTWIQVKTEIIPKVIDTPRPTNPAAGTEIDYRGIDDAWTAKITKTLVNASGVALSTFSSLNYVEMRQIKYDFPAILVGAVSIGSLSKLDADQLFYVTANIIERRNSLTNAKISTSFYASYDAAYAAMPAATVIEPLATAYNGPLLKFNFGSVLCDAQVITATTGTENPKWGFVGDNYTIVDSVPSSTDYLAWKAAPTTNMIVLPGKITQWKQNLWKLEKWEVEPR